MANLQPDQNWVNYPQQPRENSGDRGGDNQPNAPISKSNVWQSVVFWGGLMVLGLGGLGIRLWHITDLPYPIFDEVYFPAYAAEYLDGHPSWEGHPPLGKYFIMTAIALLGRNPLGCRVAEAFVGALIPILAAGLTYQLTARQWVGLLAGILVGLDGLYLVESRCGLINVFLVASGLSALIFLLAGLRLTPQDQQEDQKSDSVTQPISKFPWQRPWLLMGCGLQLGAAFSVKWNGLGFWLTVVALLGLSWGIILWQRLRFRFALAKDQPTPVNTSVNNLGFLGAMVRISWWEWLLCLGVMPVAMYVAQWLPHILLNPQRTLHDGLTGLGDLWQVFLALHRHILWWHSSAEVVPTDPTKLVHPYCSPWYSWPVDARPVGYYFYRSDKSFIDVHALGNPILWWCSTGTVIFLTVRGLLVPFISKAREKFNPTVAAILIGYTANYLPWVITKRCLFIYHYMAASLFSFMALALVLQWLWDSGSTKAKTYQIANQIAEVPTEKIPTKGKVTLGQGICAVTLTAIAVTFVFFLPIWLVTPLSVPEFYWRMWFRPDIPRIPGFNWI